MSLVTSDTEHVPTNNAKLWTYTLPSADGRHTLNMPTGAQVLALRELINDRDPMLVVWVDALAEMEPREFVVMSMGQPVPQVNLAPVGVFHDGTRLKFAFEVVD